LSLLILAAMVPYWAWLLSRRPGLAFDRKLATG